MERVIDCPCCNDADSCFEEVQEQFSSFICFKCGFMSDSRFKRDSLQTIENEKSTPKLVTDLKFEDEERDIIWYPSVINMGALGMIFPEGNPKIGTGDTQKLLKYLKVKENNMRGIHQDLILITQKHLIRMISYQRVKKWE